VAVDIYQCLEESTASLKMEAAVSSENPVNIECECPRKIHAVSTTGEIVTEFKIYVTHLCFKKSRQFLLIQAEKISCYIYKG
jgi:hypothetical protein